MNPDHHQLAMKECEELLEFDLIEPSDSQWACEAFYVNKRAEQTRGKLSDTLEEHINLLRQFEALVTQYGIMLSAKKMVLAQIEIDFLGMYFVQGEYSPGPHICQELLKFLDTNLTTKQIQQFLGIVNCVRDFIPNISIYISPLTEMLKKNAPPWGKKQDEAVKEIKEIYKNVKSLYIPSDGKKILQTDANNEYWSAVLFEEKDG
ncbi:putative mitochondrial protein AtMg00860 [Nicotiana tabacum]|uniref:Mitochondrial protein AtMg00860 n=1 Tax=Nicotiana tabacum TaxID=4097 RepID=A0AC58RRL6_TOBAC